MKYIVTAKPGSGVNKVVWDDEMHATIWCTSKPTKGDATTHIHAILAEALGIPKTCLILLAGRTGRVKTFGVLD
ncbi:hypothetical protein BH11PAT4_BH11PAT4_6060 [soil metagenome]